MNRGSFTTLALSLGAMILAAPICQADDSLPDWSGVWQVKGSMAVLSRDDARMFVPGTRDYAPLKPKYESRYKADLVHAEHQGDPGSKSSLTDTNTLHCFAGMPRLSPHLSSTNLSSRPRRPGSSSTRPSGISLRTGATGPRPMHAGRSCSGAPRDTGRARRW